MSRNAYNEKNERYIKQIELLLQELPSFLKDYIYHIEGTVLPSTRYSYLCEIKEFFLYLVNQHNSLNSCKDVNLEILDSLRIQDFNEYLHEIRNQVGEKAESRKITAIRNLFDFLCTYGYINCRDAYAIKHPKIHKNDTITYLEQEELHDFLAHIESGSYLTGKQKKWHDKTKMRDLALLGLMLGTGIRISECVELDIQDIDLQKNMIHIIRKGNKETNIFFSDSTKDYLQPYIESRKKEDVPSPALFLNRDKERISPRSVQKLVKKYAVPSIVGVKHITPHKLRSTYGEALYEMTGDIYLVADVLGHESVDTTKKHYTTVTEKRKQKAGQIDIFENKQKNPL